MTIEYLKDYLRKAHYLELENTLYYILINERLPDDLYTSKRSEIS